MSQLQSLIDGAYVTARKGYYRDALDEFNLILTHSPKCMDALFGAAGCHYRLSQYPEAMETVERVIRLDPKNAKAKELREQISRTEMVEASGPTRVEPFHLPEAVHDPFGTHKKKSTREVIPEWQMLNPKEETFGSHVRDGKDWQSDRLKIFEAVRIAWTTQRNQFGRFYGSVWILILLLGIFASILASLMTPLFGLLGHFRLFSTLWLYFCCFLACLSVQGLFAVYTHKAFCLLEDGESAQKLSVSEKVVKGIRAATACWFLLIPTLILMMGNLIGVLAPTAVLEGGSNGWVCGGILLFQVILFFRCWFVNLVVTTGDSHPVESLSHAFYGVRGQNIRLALFVAIQMILFPFAVILLGIGIPFLFLLQAAAFRQIYRPD